MAAAGCEVSSKTYQFIWFPSNLLDRIANIIILFIILALFVVGFDYAKAPAFDLTAIRSVIGVRVFGALLLAALGIVVTWGLAREEYVTNERALLPAVSAYAVLATVCSLAWLVRGLFSMTPYVLTTSRPIDWAVFLEIMIGGQLLAVLNIGTLYYKKGDGATVRAFANSYALAQKLLQQLFSNSTPVNVREALIPSLQAELTSIGGKSNQMNVALHGPEAKFANDICKAAVSLEKAIAGHLHAQTARNPRMVLGILTDALDKFGVK